MTNVSNISEFTTEQDAIDFFTALLDEHLAKNWDIDTIDFKSKLTTSDGYTCTFRHIWSDNWKLKSDNHLPYDPTQPLGKRFPHWATLNFADKRWVGNGGYLEVHSEGIASKARSSITVHSSQAVNPVFGSVFVHYRIFDRVLMSAVPHNLEKVVVKWAIKNKRHVSANISPCGYWEAQGSELQKNSKMKGYFELYERLKDTTTAKKGPKINKAKKDTVTPINKKRV